MSAEAPPATGAERQRIDRWLFFARIVKSRTLAARLAQSGRVRVNRRKIDQPSHAVGAGDVLTITLERSVRVLKIKACGTRRGPFSEARLLYDDLAPPAPATKPIAPGQRASGQGRPTKRERRRLEAWWDGGTSDG